MDQPTAFQAAAEAIFQQWGLVSMAMILSCIGLILHSLGC